MSVGIWCTRMSASMLIVFLYCKNEKFWCILISVGGMYKKIQTLKKIEPWQTKCGDDLLVDKKLNLASFSQWKCM